MGGVEVSVDLRESTYDDEVVELFQKHGFLLFRDQNLTLEQQRRIIGKLGPILDDWTTVGYVSNTRVDGMLGDIDVSFHSDFIYTESPLLGISLHAIDVQYEATWTKFANGLAALKALPDDLRRRIAELESVNLYGYSSEAINGRQRLEGYPEDAPVANHPVIATDPITNLPVLYVTQQNTAALKGVEESESEELLAELYGYLYAPSNIYQHRWRNGDMVVWSNHAFQHARGGLTPGVTRTLQRVTITECQDSNMYRPPVPADRLPPQLRTA
ncbi:TauD/TfdA dioxygenase family protein [Sphingobium sp. TKS]|uniref:TauD/TfdA dioxygenase family protein n=1 Tax=Sphingobium sp. TKS TaxID=1315974 RepID=UPI0013143E30|nr:TauD/TfdA family dioxygenase [Sphingobium sp. TKS]